MEKNFLFACATPDYVTNDFLEKLEKDISINNIVLVIGLREETNLYSEKYIKIYREDAIVGNFKDYKVLFDVNKTIVDDDLLSAIAPDMLPILVQQNRFEEQFKYRIPSSLTHHYNILIENIRFWETVLETFSITDLVLSNIPHGGYWNVIYELAKQKKVRMIINRLSTLPERKILLTDYKEVFWPVNDEYERLKTLDKCKVGDLSKGVSEHFSRMTSLDVVKMKQDYLVGNSRKEKFERRYGGGVNPFKFAYWYYGNTIAKNRPDGLWKNRLFSLFTLSGIKIHYNMICNYFFNCKMWGKTQKLEKQYGRLAVRPVNGEKYIYYAIQYVPELTSSTMGGGWYFDQRTVIIILSQSIPDDWMLYIKIHPAQLAHCFDISFFDMILELKNVRIISEEVNSNEIVKNAQCVSTLSGSVAWEAQFFNKPVLTFGYSEKNSYPLSYYVRTVEDCRRTIEEICSNRKRVSRDELILFCKALENVSYSPEEEGEYTPFIDFYRNKYGDTV